MRLRSQIWKLDGDTHEHQNLKICIDTCRSDQSALQKVAKLRCSHHLRNTLVRAPLAERHSVGTLLMVSG
jgi:hypothetical protein